MELNLRNINNIELRAYFDGDYTTVHGLVADHPDDIKKLKEQEPGMYNVKIDKSKKTRSKLQNRALHKFFHIISEKLNNLGHTCQLTCIISGVSESRFTMLTVKEDWRRKQEQLFGFKSTTKLNTEQMNEMIDIYVLFFAEMGEPLMFPCRSNEYAEWLIEQENKKYS